MPRELTDQEVVALGDKIIAGLPKGLTDQEFERAFNPRFEAAAAEAQNTPAAPEGSVLGRFVSGVAQVLNPITAVEGLYGAVRHPIDTATNIYQTQKQQFEKAGTAPTLSEKVGYTAAGLLPVLGPAAAQAGETVASGDVAGGLGQTAGLLAPAAASEAMSIRRAPNPRAAEILTRQAEEQVAGRVLAPGAPAYRGRAAAIAPEVLARKMTGGRAELQQAAEEGMADAGTKLDEAIEAAGGVKAQIPVSTVVQKLKGKIGELQDSSGQPLSGQAAARISALKERIDSLKNLGLTSQSPLTQKGVLAREHPDFATFEDLRKVRDENYRLADEARGYQRMGNPAMSDEGWAARETGSAVRETFAERSPKSAQANADYTFFKTLNDVLDPVLGRPKSQALPTGVTGGARTVGAVTGALLGPKTAFIMGAVVPWLRERLASPGWQLADAQSKLKLAAAMRRGDVGLMKTIMAKWGPATSEGGNLLALPPGVPSLSAIQAPPPTPDQSAGR